MTRSAAATSAVGIHDSKGLETWVLFPSIRSMMATFAEALRLAIEVDILRLFRDDPNDVWGFYGWITQLLLYHHSTIDFSPENVRSTCELWY